MQVVPSKLLTLQTKQHSNKSAFLAFPWCYFDPSLWAFPSVQTRKAREYTRWHKTASVQRKWNKYYLSRFLDYLAKRDRKFRRYNYPTYNIKVKRKVAETRLALGQELPYSLMMHCATLSCSPSRPISYHNWQRCCKLLNQSCFNNLL